MDPFSWFVIEMMVEARMDELRYGRPASLRPSGAPREAPGGVKRALAATLVRLGLRLDPAAGEGLGAFDLSRARPDARRQA